MTILAQLLVILVLARAFGEGAARLGQPAAMGEIVAGIALAVLAAAAGPNVAFAANLLKSELFHHAATIGIFFLMLLAGLELKPREITEGSWKALLVAVGGILVPLACGFALGYGFLPPSDKRFAIALLIAVAISITAIPASVRILAELDLLHRPVGRTIIAAALFDDVIGLMLLAVLAAVIRTGGLPGLWEFLWLLAKIGLFFGVTMGVGVHVYPRVSRKLRTLQATALELSVLTAVALAYGLAAELLGLHWILGAFMAGLFFEPDRVGLRAYDGNRLIVGGITAGLFGPIFFASIGARIDLLSMVEAPVFVLLVIALAIITKLVGAGLPALAIGFNRRESVAIGMGMSSRGAVELVILSIAVESGLVIAGPQAGVDTHHVYSSLVLMAVVTTLLAPLLMRMALGREGGRAGPEAGQPPEMPSPGADSGP